MTTVVTCYYRFPSKHSYNEYDQWINNFFKYLKCPIILFTSREMKSYFENMINQYNSNVFLIYKEFEDLTVFQKYDHIWHNQHEIDPQKNIRTKECYIVWNSKLEFIKEAIEINTFKSSKFIWSDIGNIRETPKFDMTNYPIYENISNDKIDIVLVEPFTDDEENLPYFFNCIHFSGSMFGGSIQSLLQFYSSFYQKFEEYIHNEKFIGCDQQIIASVYIKNKNSFNVVSAENDIIDKWFYLYKKYSS